MILSSFEFEETIVIREIRSSVESAPLVSDFHVGWSLRSGNGWTKEYTTFAIRSLTCHAIRVAPLELSGVCVDPHPNNVASVPTT